MINAQLTSNDEQAIKLGKMKGDEEKPFDVQERTLRFGDYSLLILNFPWIF
jgi:hypothetical protein